MLSVILLFLFFVLLFLAFLVTLLLDHGSPVVLSKLLKHTPSPLGDDTTGLLLRGCELDVTSGLLPILIQGPLTLDLLVQIWR